MGCVQNFIKLTKRPNLFMLKNENEQLTSFGPTWSQFKLGQRLRQKSENGLCNIGKNWLGGEC